MAREPSTTGVLDAESSSPTLSSQYPGRPIRAPSVESLHFSTPSSSSSGAPQHPNVLKKRHSTYALSSSGLGSSPVGLDRNATLPPLPDIPLSTAPLRPLRNPARPISHMPPPPQRKKPRSRPSTTDSGNDRAEVTPWEFQSLQEEAEGETPTAKLARSVRSHASSTALEKPTGPVELVTPWEVQSLEQELVEIEKVYEHEPPSLRPRASSGANATATSTGPIEEVTPWELHPVPAVQPQQTTSTIYNTPNKKGRSSTSLHSHGSSNLSSPNASQHSPSSQTQISPLSSPQTRIANFVGSTPLPPNSGRPHSNSTSTVGSFPASNHNRQYDITSQLQKAPSYPRSTHSSLFGHTDTGPVDDVTPWELQPGPDNSGLLVGATASNFTPASVRRSASRPSSAKGQGSAFASPPSSANGEFNGAGLLLGTQRAAPSLPSGGTLVPSHSSSSQSLALKPNSYGAGTGGKVGSTGGVGLMFSSPSLGLGSKGTGDDDSITPIPFPPPLSSQHLPAPSHVASRNPLPNVEPLDSRKPPSVASRSLASKQSNLQLQNSTRPAPTGPTEDVTPWELHPATLPLPDAGVSSKFLRRTSQEDKERIVAGGRLGWSKSLDDVESERIQRKDLAKDNAIDLEDDLAKQTHAGLVKSVSGTSIDRQTKQVRPRASMTLDQLEEVMPWELYPPPPPPAVDPLPGISTTIAGVGESGPSGKRRAPLADLRRRRSTGGSGMTTSSGGISGGGSTRRGSKLKDHEDIARSHKLSSAGVGGADGIISPLAVSPTAHDASISSSQLPLSSSPPSSSMSTTPQPPKFSTPDRTILEQLKAKLQAREAQFVLKGVGHTIVGEGRSPGKRYHPYSKEMVPYPRSYGTEVVDLDVWETLFALDICESLTWHVFETPPTKVLEIGCGTGTWILRCAEAWKECHFVGLDIVPLHPDLQIVGSDSDSASRITWVQHNFLDGLPFQNEEFDFVHIKRIALGVPEHMWDDLFVEIMRVMKPGGAFEMIEEDLFFPGKPADDDDELVLSMRDGYSPSMTRRNSVSSDNNHTSFNGDEGIDEQPETPTAINHSMHRAQAEPFQSASPIPARVNGRDYSGRKDLEEWENQSFTKPSANSTRLPITTLAAPPSAPAQVVGHVPPHSRSAFRPPLHLKTQRNGTAADPSQMVSAAHPTLFGSTVSLLGSLGHIAHHDPSAEVAKKQQQQRERTASQTSAAGSSPKETKASPFMLHSLTNSPTNPRDHTILQAIWNGMLGSRFVNLAPLSLLTNSLGYHFKDVRTHPPLMFTFPLLPVKTKVEEVEGDGEQTGLLTDSEPDTDDARDAVIPRPKRPRSAKSKKTSGWDWPTPNSFNDEIGKFPENRPNRLSFVTSDEPSYSPKTTTFPTKTMKEAGLRRTSRLPNTTVKTNLKMLNLHLALRAKEVIACSEPMWEWVLEYQAQVTSSTAHGDGRNRSGSLESYMLDVDGSRSNSSLYLTRNVILEMTRDDFDRLLNNFEMDMLDKASVGNALQERFDWHVFPSPILQDRKAFNTACEKYDDWATTQKVKPPSDPYHRSNIHRSKSLMTAPGLVLPTPASSVSHDHNRISRSTSSPTSSASYQVDDTSSIATTVVPSLTKSHHHRNHSESTVHALSSPISQTSTQSMPTQMLSRVMRVFVAWKAS